MRTVFMGSDAIVLPSLESLRRELSEWVDLVAVYTQPDRRSGRGMKLVPNGVKQWAEAEGIACFQPATANREVGEQLREIGCELLLVMAYGHFLGRSIREAPRYRPLNLHGSLLPRLRGASPIQAAIGLGLKETGVSLMEIVREMDAGPVYGVEKVPIEPEDTAGTLWGKMAAAGVPLLRRELPKFLAGELAPWEQDSAKATYARKLTKEDGAIDFGLTAREVCDRFRALQPWPGCFFSHNGQKIKVGRMECDKGWHDAEPGRVLTYQGGEGLVVGTADGCVAIRELQRPGGRMLPVADFLRGYAIRGGELLESSRSLPLEFAQPFAGGG